MSRRSSAAFTLIEVMAAAVILGLFVASISTLMSEGARREGDARRQAEASALADDEIAKLEEGFARGAAPPIGTGETLKERFRVASRVRAFDASQLAPAAPRQPVRDAPAPPGASCLTGAAAKQTPPLLEVEVRVTWDGAPVDDETGEPVGVRRLTFLLNPAALEALPKKEAAEGNG
jgi:prepilin-type N-terminal cleavage/methylation domain-containing protein